MSANAGPECYDAHQPEEKMLLQLFAHLQRDVSHLIEIFGRLLPEPFIDLLSPKRLFSFCYKEVFDVI